MTSQTTTAPEQRRHVQKFAPAVDIEESHDAIVVWADLPGVSKEALQVTLENDILTLEAHVAPDERAGYRLVHQEYHQGDFRRAFTISDAIDQDRIAAVLENGVLRLELPKVAPKKPRRIAIKSS